MKQSGVVCKPGAALLFFIFPFWYLISGPNSYRDFRETGPRPHFLWPRVDLARLWSASVFLVFLASKSVGFVSLSGKASLVSISATILFLRSWHVYFPLEFEFRGKSCVEWEHVGKNGISCLLPCILLLYIEWIWTNYHETSLEH